MECNIPKYDIFQFGALYLDNKIQRIPQQPKEKGDVPQYDEQARISIGPAGQGVTWVKPHGLNLLISDRVLLTNISWEDLDKNGFVTGKTVLIDGHRFRCRLLQVGVDENVPNEWDRILKIAGINDYLWHWKQMYFWGADMAQADENCRAVRGFASPHAWGDYWMTLRCASVGFRPVLEPLGVADPATNCILDGTSFWLGSIPGSSGFCPILQPVQHNTFAGIPDGWQVKMYTLMGGKYPVHREFGFSSASKLTLSDRYYGDEYLVSWTIANGIAVATQTL